MFNLFRRPPPMDRHFIDDGRVYCPVRACDVEFDLCASCPRLIEIERKAAQPFVRCEPKACLDLARAGPR